MGKSFEQSLTEAELVYTDKQPQLARVDRTDSMLNECLGKVSSSINKFANKADKMHRKMKQGDTLGAAADMFTGNKKQEPQEDPNSLFAGQNNQQNNQQTRTNLKPQNRQPSGTAQEQWQQYLQPTWDKMPPEMRNQFADDFNAFVQYKMQEANFRRQGHKI